MTLGKVARGNADWRRQLELSRGRPAPGAYLALRLADYEAAIPYLEAALQAAPFDPYWKLYLHTAKARTGQPVQIHEQAAKGMAGDAARLAGRCSRRRGGARPGRYTLAPG